MWGYSGRHLDLSSGGGEDEAPVILRDLLRLRGTAQHRQRPQRRPHDATRAHTLSQVSESPKIILRDLILGYRTYKKNLFALVASVSAPT